MFLTHILAVNTANIKKVPLLVFAMLAVNNQTYPVWVLRTSNIPTRLHCNLTTAAAFRVKEQLCFKKKRQPKKKKNTKNFFVLPDRN